MQGFFPVKNLGSGLHSAATNVDVPQKGSSVIKFNNGIKNNNKSFVVHSMPIDRYHHNGKCCGIMSIQFKINYYYFLFWGIYIILVDPKHVDQP